MRTGDQRRYYDILRREAGSRKTRHGNGSALVSERSSSLGTRAAAAATTHTFSSAQSGVNDGAEQSIAYSSGAPAVCDPLAELNIPLTRVPAVTDFVCNRRGFTSLHSNFLRFEHLRCIVVEHNAFETLHNLVVPEAQSSASSAAATVTGADELPSLSFPPPLFLGCRRLTHLHAAHNLIRDIAVDTDIPRLTLLEHLSLAHNQLTNLDKVLHALRRLKNLRFLDLRGNPVTGEPRYRKRCVAALPQVEILDCQLITPKEREAAVAAVRWNQRAYVDRPRTTNATFTAAPVSTLRPGTSPNLTKRGRVAGDPFAKSLTAKDLERKHVAYLRQREQAQEAEAQSTCAAWRQQEETWESFHALWTLSQPGMPLSADAWQRAQALETATASENRPRDTEKPETRGAIIASTPNPRQPASSPAELPTATSSLSTSRKQTHAPSPTNVGSGNSTARPELTLDVPLDRPLFPLSPAPTATSPLPLVHDSVYFRILRNGAPALRNGTVPLPPTTTPPPAESRLFPVEGPAPDRLEKLQRTLQASTLIVRAAAACQGSLETPKKTAVAFVAAVQERAGSGRRNGASSSPSQSPAVVGRSTPVPFSTLRTIQENKYAVIPPPWENARGRGTVLRGAAEWPLGSPCASGATPNMTDTSEATTHSIGPVATITAQQEALAEILVLLYDVFSLNEIQALEEEYGSAELLRLLPLREWLAPGAENGAGTTVSISVAARQAMTLLSRPHSAGSNNGSNTRSSAPQHERKRAGAKGTGHGGNAGTSSAATRGGTADTAGGAPTPAIALAAAAAALPREPEQVWQLLTGPYIVAGATTGGSPGVMASLSKNNCGTASNTASGVSTSSFAGAATPPAASLHDPEVVQHLVRPIGPYTSHVLGPLLGLLGEPVAEEDVQLLCDALVDYHAVKEQVTAAATAAVVSVLRTTGTEPQHRSANTGLKNKRESLQGPEESYASEVKRKKVVKVAASAAALADTVTSSLPSSLPSSASSQRRYSGKSGQMPLQHQPQSVTTQLTLTAVLTALLFSPTFVRARVTNLEEKLQRLAPRTAANSIIAAADNSSLKNGTNHADQAPPSLAKNSHPTGTLTRLFHRVQAVKMHATRLEAALADASLFEATNKTCCLLDPKKVLTAYSGRR